MSKMIFVNLPVTDLDRSKTFYEAMGARHEPKFSHENAAMMAISDTIIVMLLRHGYYSTYTGKKIADAHDTSQVLLGYSGLRSTKPSILLFRLAGLPIRDRSRIMVD
jgi:predicted lactoylglutathione lyase